MKESGTRPFGPEVCTAGAATRHYWNIWNILQIGNGVLMRYFVMCGVKGDHFQSLVQRTMNTEILQHVHNSLFWGHLGQKKTREKALQRFYWSVIWEDCNIWVTKCDDTSSSLKAYLGEMLVGEPLHKLATDIWDLFLDSTILLGARICIFCNQPPSSLGRDLQCT